MPPSRPAHPVTPAAVPVPAKGDSQPNPHVVPSVYWRKQRGFSALPSSSGSDGRSVCPPLARAETTPILEPVSSLLGVAQRDAVALLPFSSWTWTQAPSFKQKETIPAQLFEELDQTSSSPVLTFVVRLCMEKCAETPRCHENRGQERTGVLLLIAAAPSPGRKPHCTKPALWCSGPILPRSPGLDVSRAPKVAVALSPRR
ncbi:uncharacterized protein [Anser cygnoides]|uniref:uncharacterized protein n=1 Tax=Anser cygnoides TaxID=8845 RepID=UPI0034D2AD3D